MSLKIDSELKTCFPDLNVLTFRIKGVQIQKRGVELEKFKVEVMRQVRNDYNLDAVKDQPTFRAYRDFFLEHKNRPNKNPSSSRGFDSKNSGRKNSSMHKHYC